MLGIVPSLLRRNTQFSTCMAHISSRMPTCAATAAAANIHQPDASYAVSEIASHLTRQSTRGFTKPASQVHTVFHMYGTYTLLYANMCCNCCCCQHPPTGCIICGVRSNLTSDPAKHLAYCLIGLQAFRPAIVYCRNTCLTTSIFGICSGSLPIPPIYTVLTETRRASMSPAAEHRSLNYYG